MENQQTITKIKIINWAMIFTALMYPLAWFVLPSFMLNQGGAFIILCVFNTLLLFKLLSFSKDGWNENLRQIKKSGPWLIYIALMAVTIHYYLQATYWGPKRQKAIRATEEKHRTR